MAPVQYALAEIRDRFPEEILRLAFLPKTRYAHIKERYSSTTIEQAILRDVINTRVRRKLDIHGMQETTIRLDGLPITPETYQAWSCHIPKSLTKGRTITQALGIHVGFANVTGAQGIVGLSGTGMITQNSSLQACNMGVAGQAMADMLQNARPMEQNYTANVYLIGENTIYCEDRMPMSNLVLRCLVGSDEEFSSIQGGYIDIFSEICVLATEAYIYNNQRVVMDKASLEGGVEIGIIREYVDKYADAEDRLKELMETKGRKMIRMSDKPRARRYLRMLTVPGG